MAEIQQHPEKKDTWKLIIAVLFLVGLIMTPFFQMHERIDPSVITTGTIFVLAIFLWISRIIPASLTAICVIVLFAVFDVITFEQAASGLGNEIIWLVLSVLFMGLAVEKTNLDKRIAYSILSFSKGSVRATLFNLIISAFLLTFLIPNAVGRLAVLMPIGKGIIESMQKEAGENIGKSIMLIVTYAPYITTVALLTGASGSIYATGLFENMVGYSWGYLNWMVVMIPMVLVTLLALWLILIYLFPTNVVKIKETQLYFEKKRKEMGSVTTPEKKLLFIYIVLITLWVTKDLHHLSISLSAVMMLIFLFLPGINILDWKSSLNKIDWGVPLLFAAGFAIANAFESSGITSLLSDFALLFLLDLPTVALAFTLMIVFIIIRLCFTNFNAMVATLMPVAITFALSTPYNPIWVGMISLVACSTAFILPTQAIGSMMTFTLGYYDNKDMLKAGGLLTLCIIVITILFSFLYWPYVGLPVA